jgi:methylmalonyl-CoA mutase cobalamin-binding subunit
MEGFPLARPPEAGLSPAELRQRVESAFLRSDDRLARDTVLAAAAGTPVGRLYVEVLRPALAAALAAELGPGRDTRRRILVSGAQAVVALLAGQIRGRHQAGAGRQAIVSSRTAALPALDGRVVADHLEADGWAVLPVDAQTEPHGVAELARGTRAELVVLAGLDARHVLLSARTSAMLKELDPRPLVLGCALDSGGTAHAGAAGVDGVATAPDGLVDLVEQRLTERSSQRWGVRLERTGAVLRIAPLGNLDADGGRRLRLVVGSRMGTFDRVLVDLAGVRTIDADGAAALRALRDELRPEGAALQIV